MPPLAQCYHGWQFGVLNKGLGDGRAFTWGQWRRGAEVWDLGTKGSGKTPFARGHDGQLTLEGALREVIGSEALAACGVRTSRMVAVVETGGRVLRGSPGVECRGAVLVRASQSLLRFGTFERLLHLGLAPAELRAQLKVLAGYCLRQTYPHLLAASEPEPEPELGPGQEQQQEQAPEPCGCWLSLFSAVCRRTAEMVAAMMSAGFTHGKPPRYCWHLGCILQRVTAISLRAGVLNTDNLSLAGEVIDYGPFAFLSSYDAGFVAASFDAHGQYAFGAQTEACRWALCRLGVPFHVLGAFDSVPTGDKEAKVAAVVEREFSQTVDVAYRQRMVAKLGFGLVGSADGAGGPEASDATARRLALEERLSRTTRALFRRAGISMHEFFTELADCVAAVGPESQLGPEFAAQLEGCSFAGTAASLASKEWAEFGAAYTGRLALALELGETASGVSAAVLSQRLPMDLGDGVVEEVWRSIAEGDDWRPFERLTRALDAHGARRPGSAASVSVPT